MTLINRFSNIIFTLLLFLSIFNYRFFSLGPGDYFLFISLVYVFLTNRNFVIKNIDIYILLFFGFLYFASGLSQLSFGSHKIFDFLGFAYKYLILFFILLLSRNIDISPIFLRKIMLFTWMTLVAWTIYYGFFRLNAVSAILIPGQISFPGTGSGESINADSHLYAYVLGFIGLFLSLYSLKFKVTIFLITLFCILLTGSRNPLALYFLVLFVYFISSLTIKDLIRFILIILFVTVSIILIIQNFDMLEEFLPTVRSLQISLDDVSAINRVKKFILALEGVDNSLLFLGESILRSNVFWADGIHSMLIIHFGFFGLLGYFAWLIFYFIRVRSFDRILNNKNLTLLSTYAFFGLFITEFLLVTRGAILVFLPLGICYFNSQNKYKEILFAQRK